MGISENKKCNKCLCEKTLDSFYLIKSSNNYRNTCKICFIDNKKKNYHSNIEDIRLKAKKKQRIYRTKNPEIIENYKVIKNEIKRERRKKDPLFKLEDNIRSLIAGSFKKKSIRKNTKTQNILGCTIDDFKKHIESKWESWMTWENHGKYNINYKTWQLDHIKPVSLALSKEELIKINNYTNFQPLEAMANLKKSNKYVHLR
jgi:hypothetical protein